MHKTIHLLVGIAVVATMLPADALAVRLVGRVVRVGFGGRGESSDTTGADLYRVGQWTPVLVELDNQDGDSFQGTIEVKQSDRDGDDTVAARQVDVRSLQRYYLYVPGGDSDRHGMAGQQSFTVRVLDAGGRLVRLHNEENREVVDLTPPRPIIPCYGDARIILDISKAPVSQLTRLTTEDKSNREVIRLRIAPEEMVDQPEGLEMADIIVWDAADPGSDFRDPAQLSALIEWTRRGGTLVLGVSRNWEIISKSDLGPLLPARLRGSTPTTSIPEALKDTLFSGVDDSLIKPFNYCPVTLESLERDAWSVVPPRPEAGDTLMATRRPCGGGSILLVAAELGDLLSRGVNNRVFLQQLLAFRDPPTQDDNQKYYRHTDLFRQVEQVTSFGTTAGVYFLLAFLFVVTYVALSTGGSWVWLKRKGMIQHAWMAFGFASVAASLVSLAAVQWIRGIGNKVEEMTVVDARADEYAATATMYIGLKTAAHTTLDLCVPRDWVNPDDASNDAAGMLRPLPPNPLAFDTGKFKASQRYEAVAGLGQLRTVPLRATLKQLEAIWEGQMKGRVAASLSRESGTASRLHPNSWIRNELGTNLDQCYLLVAARSADWSRRNANQIQIWPLGKLADATQLTIGTFEDVRLKEEAEQRQRRRRRADPTEEESGAPERWQVWTLNDAQRTWLDNLGIKDNEYYYGGADENRYESFNPQKFASALLLLTCFEELDQASLSQTLDRSQGQRLDRSVDLTTDTALFVGFSEDPGPARLCWRKAGADGAKWKPIHPTRAHVMYRIAIPIAK